MSPCTMIDNTICVILSRLSCSYHAIVAHKNNVVCVTLSSSKIFMILGNCDELQEEGSSATVIYYEDEYSPLSQWI